MMIQQNGERLGREEARARIEQEDNLINHRVSWLVGSQSFLLTAFVLLRNNPDFYPLANGKLPNGSPIPPGYLFRTSLLAYLICITGIVVCVCSLIGVFAAFVAIKAWRDKVKQEEAQHLTSSALINFCGGLAAILPPAAFLSVWVLLLQDAADVSRLSTGQIRMPLKFVGAAALVWVLYTLWRFRLDVKASFRDRG